VFHKAINDKYIVPLQQANLSVDPIKVLGAVTNRITQITPSDHPDAPSILSEAFHDAIIVRDAAVEIADPVLEAAMRSARREILLEDCGENLKTLAAAAALESKFSDLSPSRVVAIGSGCLINMVTYAMAGEPHTTQLAIVPTNAMSIADVAFGGLGLLNDQDKNDIRKERDPDLIILSRSIFAASPPKQQRDGQIEVVKHLIFQDVGDNIQSIRSLLGKDFSLDSDALFEFSTLGLKLNILLRYAARSGQESATDVLTFGHSHAHALEKASGFRLEHSEAVRFGMAVDCAFIRPDLAAILAEAPWPTELLQALKVILRDGALDLDWYEAKYVDDERIFCLHPWCTTFPFGVASEHIPATSIARKMQGLP
jgi:3-dehydroquinate synthetase